MLDDELPDCVGNPDATCPAPRQPVLIKGYDDKMRCVSCNKLHIELVYHEAGDSTPTTGSRNVVAPNLERKISEAERLKQAVRAKCAPRDGWTSPPQIRAAPGELVDMKGRRFEKDGTVSEPGKTETSDEERRRAILKKYSKRVDGNAMGA